MKQLLILPHFGMGDQLVTCGLVRALSGVNPADCHVMLLCYQDHQATLHELYKDRRNITLMPVDSVQSGVEMAKALATDAAWEVLRLGSFNGEPWKETEWAEEYYRQAGLESHLRYAEFRLPVDQVFATPPPSPYIFVHDDAIRGFVIDSARLPRLPLFSPNGYTGHPIFWYLNLLRAASEIHCIDSSFMILVDQMPAHHPTQRLVFHKYARPGGNPPSLRKEWEILE